MSDVLARVTGHLGHLTLNRPAALNALTDAMVRDLDAALVAWADDDRVRAVLIDGAGERGLCAGGDVRALYHAARAGDGATARAFWAHEYRLNARIAAYPKPYVAFMDGLVMGGGVGVSAHGTLRIVTERTQLAMPEVRIGFVPDVGVTHLLARAGHAGTHLALTGTTVTGADAIACGLADHWVPADRLPALRAALADTDPAAAAAAAAAPPPPAPLAAAADWIADCYAADSVPAILDRLRARGGPAAAAAAEIAARSPMSLTLTLELLRRGATGTVVDALDREYAVATALLDGPDFAEGVRAQLIDKDRNPRWDPPTLAAVDPAAVAAALAGTGEPRPRT
ncbi:3-hydroxyisobutyryl-CoA hydrolase [Pilimelia anulata]|uniref:3-hydroxyisobutyryl-CoA hydrolase n=1 Tax=Pilimelia anulata TaxID=53371 RepID=A0A8J3BEY5_9ACTN|nr:enoyl-CoA hydratase/isomerase family protein [Pilimelia anulata]GGK02504.1 3-hydroxyisobutyryl-CoA hydrolase [Pilimelia anulata]